MLVSKQVSHELIMMPESQKNSATAPDGVYYASLGK